MALWYSLDSQRGGLQGKHKALVAMVVWQEQRCILVLEPNATLIFSLASLQLSHHSLFVSPSSPLLSATIHFLPACRANLKSTALCKEVRSAKTLCARQQNLREVTLLLERQLSSLTGKAREMISAFKHGCEWDAPVGLVLCTLTAH